jgi:hypothetical protein
LRNKKWSNGEKEKSEGAKINMKGEKDYSRVVQSFFPYSKHASDMNTVHWSPNAANVVSGDQNGVARVWQAV